MKMIVEGVSCSEVGESDETENISMKKVNITMKMRLTVKRRSVIIERESDKEIK